MNFKGEKRIVTFKNNQNNKFKFELFNFRAHKKNSQNRRA